MCRPPRACSLASGSFLVTADTPTSRAIAHRRSQRGPPAVSCRSVAFRNRVAPASTDAGAWVLAGQAPGGPSRAVGPAACEALAPGSLTGGCCRPRCPPPHHPPLPIPACGDPRSFRLPIATSPLCASVGARGGRPVPRRLRAEAEGLRVEVQASGPTGADVGGGRGGPPRASVGRGGRGGPGQRWREVPAACRVAS